MKKTCLVTACVALLWMLPAGAEEVPAANEEKMAKGLLMKYQDRLIFSPCRQRSYFTLKDASPDAVLAAKLGALGLDVGKNVYVELFGRIDGDNLHFSRINFARKEARCLESGGPDELWRASGNDPAWQLVVGEGHVLLKRQGRSALKLPYGEIKTEGDLTTISVPDQPASQWQLRQQSCRDKTAELLLGWHVEIKIDGEILQGCAWQR